MTIRTLLRGARYLVLAAVAGAIAASSALFVYGFVRTFVVIWRTVQEPEMTSRAGKLMMLYFIEIFDLFLFGTVLLIMGIGLYSLFIDPRVRLPGWLSAASFDDLKINLVAVVIVVLGVTFLGHVIAWDGDRTLLDFGGSVALMIAVLTAFLWVSKTMRGKGVRADPDRDTITPERDDQQ